MAGQALKIVGFVVVPLVLVMLALALGGHAVGLFVAVALCVLLVLAARAGFGSRR